MKRDSFILHCNSLTILEDLNDQQIAELFKAIRDYNNGKDPKLTGLMRAVFTPFRNQFDRDNEKYQAIIERNKNNGKSGGRPKSVNNETIIEQPKEAPINPKNPVGNLESQANPKNLDSDSDSDRDRDRDRDLLLKKEAKGDFSKEQKIQELEEANRALTEKLEAEKKRKNIAAKKEKKEEAPVVMPFESPAFSNAWTTWVEYKATQHSFKFKSNTTQQAALIELAKLSDGNEQIAIQIIHQSIGNGWKGLFPLKNTQNNGNSNSNYHSPQNRAERVRRRAAELEGLSDFFRVEIS